MKNYKKIIMFAGFLVLLIVIVYFPLLMINIQEKQLINQVHNETYKTQYIEDHSSHISTLEKIKYIYYYSRDNHVVLTSYQTDFNTEKHLQLLDNEIKKLINADIIPQINIKNQFVLKLFLKQTYTDISKSQNQLHIWNLTFIADGYEVKLLIDADTHLIYHIYIKKTSTLSHFDIKLKDGDILSRFLIDYLKVKENQSKQFYNIVQTQDFFEISCKCKEMYEMTVYSK